MTDLPKGWAWTTLGEVGLTGLFSDGDWVESKDQDPSGLNRLIQLADVGVGTFKDKSSRWMNDEAFERLRCTPLVADDILIARMPDPLGRACMVPNLPYRSATVVDVAILRPDQTLVDPRWLMWIINADTVSSKVDAFATGTTRRRISRKNLETISIPLPPLAEQRRIVGVLDDHLSRLDASEIILSSCVQRIRMLAAKATNYSVAERIGPYKAALPPSNADVVDGELPQLPANWSWWRLGEIADVVAGLMKDSKKQSDDSLALRPYLRVANVQAGHLDLGHIAEIRATPAQIKRLTLQKGDVLLNEGGDRDKLGRGWVWEDQVPECLHQNHVFRARVLDDVIDPRLIAWHANSFGRPWFMRNGKQSVNLASVSLTTIRAFPVPVPPRELQGVIVDRIKCDLEGLERLLDGVGVAQSRCAALRRSLLLAAFNGALVDQEPSDEPAAIALERLRAESKPIRKRAAKSSAMAATRS